MFRVGHERGLGLFFLPSRLGRPSLSEAPAPLLYSSKPVFSLPQLNLARGFRRKLGCGPWTLPFLCPSWLLSPFPPIPHPLPYVFSFFRGWVLYLVGEGMVPDPVTSACPAPHSCETWPQRLGIPLSHTYLPQGMSGWSLSTLTTLASHLPLYTFVSPRSRTGLSPHNFLRLFYLKHLF